MKLSPASLFPRRSAGAVLAASALLLTACTGSPGTPAPSTPVAAAGVSGTPGAGPCVADVNSVISRAQTPAMARDPLPAETTAVLDAAARTSFEEAATPGAIVGVRTPQGTWAQAYGLADPATRAPMAVGQHTRIGSVTKTFTGTVILRLAEDGKLGLDDPISKYVPGVPNGDRVTLRHLASMTSGVASYTRDTKFTDRYFADPEQTFTADELLAVGLAQPPLFEPGTEFDYSNTNTLLLGKVAESVTGMPQEAAMQEFVLDPLRLEQTSWPGTSRDLPEPYAQGFTLQGNTATPQSPANATNWSPSWMGAAGILVSDMNDLLTYGRALGTGQGLLGPAMQAERLRSIPGPSGYGLALGCVDGWVGHAGELPGYNTSVFYDTRTDTTVIVQTNSDVASGNCPESPTIQDDPRTAVCSAPATRMFVALSEALERPFTPNPQR